MTKEEYNDIPVEYCKDCLSLKIKDMSDIPYCDECGSTDIEETHIKDWEEKYKNKYGNTYLNN